MRSALRAIDSIRCAKQQLIQDDPDDNESVIVHCPISSKYMSTAVQGELLVPHMLVKYSREDILVTLIISYLLSACLLSWLRSDIGAAA